MDIMNTKVYTLKEAADMLKANPETIKRMILAGKVRGVKVGNRWRITERELAKMLYGEEE